MNVLWTMSYELWAMNEYVLSPLSLKQYSTFNLQPSTYGIVLNTQLDTLTLTASASCTQPCAPANAPVGAPFCSTRTHGISDVLGLNCCLLTADGLPTGDRETDEEKTEGQGSFFCYDFRRTDEASLYRQVWRSGMLHVKWSATSNISTGYLDMLSTFYMRGWAMGMNLILHGAVGGGGSLVSMGIQSRLGLLQVE